MLEFGWDGDLQTLSLVLVAHTPQDSTPSSTDQSDGDFCIASLAPRPVALKNPLTLRVWFLYCSGEFVGLTYFELVG